MAQPRAHARQVQPPSQHLPAQETNDKKLWRKYPSAATEALRFCANICRPECGEAGEDARASLMEAMAAHGFVAVLSSDAALRSGSEAAEEISKQVCCHPT